MQNSRVTDYVVGFAFSKDREQVLLVWKRRPSWQAGKLNGVGGHIEPGELPLEAMRREFFEETGIMTSLRDWKHFAVVQTDLSRVFMFAATLPDLAAAKSTTDESIFAVDVSLDGWTVLPNLRWLVPLALRAADLLVPAIVHEAAWYETAA